MEGSRRGFWWLLALLAAAGLTSSLPSAPVQSLCFWRNTLGLACPGCGLTRSLAYILQGEWMDALRMHPLAPLFFLEGLCLAAARALLPARFRSLRRSRLNLWLMIHLVLLWIVWLVRFRLQLLP